MTETLPDDYVFLLESALPAKVAAAQRRLGRAGVPFRSGLLADEPPRVIISVPREWLDEARAVLAAIPPEDGPVPVREEVEEESTSEQPAPAPRARFPVRDVLVVAVAVLFHLGLVAVAAALGPPPQRLLWSGGLIAGMTFEEPWRLLTATFLHVDALHVLWNGASMLVFAVPLLHFLGYLRTGAIYLAAGVGGGLAAVTFSPAGTIIVGSSGAVAGLFGAWVVIALRLGRRREQDWRSRIRTVGIALLVLPSLLSPVTSTGRPVSVSGHVGGMLTGMLIGALIGSSLLARKTVPAIEVPS
jgi:membrane associated rhomboid family serine protease